MTITTATLSIIPKVTFVILPTLTHFRTPFPKMNITTSSVSNSDSTKLVSESDSTKLVSESDSAKLVSESDSKKLVSESDPTKSKLVSESDSAKLVSESDSTKLVSESDSTKLVSESDSIKLVSESDPTKLVSESDPTKLVSESDSIKSKLVSESDSIKSKLVSELDSIKLVSELEQSKVNNDDVLVQYVVVRRDLVDEWPTGSVITQGCHASVAAIWDYKDDLHTLQYCSPSNLASMHKVTLEVKGETQMVNLSEKLKTGGILHYLWIEQPENFPTCLATKPYPKSVAYPFFKKLKLCK